MHAIQSINQFPFFYNNFPFSPSGAPVAVGMNIDIASIDMVSEVNMVCCM